MRLVARKVKSLSRKIFKRKSLHIQPDDIFLVSYPRSGNTWMRYLLANLLEPTEIWHIGNINRVLPDTHEPWPSDWIPRTPRLLKSHSSYRYEFRRVIYLYRDGRDVAISYHHFLQKLHQEQRTFDEFFDDFIRGQVPYGSWQAHLDGWMFTEHSGQEIITLSYEKLYQTPVPEISRLAAFLGCAWSETEILTAVEKSTYRNFQVDYKTRLYDSHWNKGFRGGVKGGPGQWKETLTPQQNALFWRITEQVSSRLELEQ